VELVSVKPELRRVMVWTALFAVKLW